MAVWLVRAGRRGEQEQIALDCGVVAIGWLELPDLSAFKDRESLTETYRQLHPDASPVLVGNRVGQAWAFCHRIEKGDLAVVPLKSQAAIAIGEIIGPYRYRDDLGETVKHTRPVKWVRMDIPRTAFDADLLYSLGSQLTVCRVQRNNAEARIRAVLKGGDDPGGSEEDAGETEDGDFEDLDIENAARDQLLDYIQRKFAGHKLAELVDAVLQAEGYLTRVSPPGPDGGVDILAGSGPLGFGEPRMCVQVKSSASPIDVTVLRGLQVRAITVIEGTSIEVIEGMRV